MDTSASNDETIWRVPPPELSLTENEVNVWRIPLDVPVQIRTQLQQALSPEEIQRAQRFRFDIHRHRWMVAHGVLRILLSRYLGVEPPQIQFVTNAYGKPFIFLPQHGTRLHFNLSHSNTLALCAFTYDRHIGVDVEYMSSKNYDDDLAKYTFSESEYRALHALPEAQQKEAFFLCWTRKEAYIKAKGKGLSIAPHQFDVSLTPGEPARLLASREEPQALTLWSLQTFEPGHGYSGALCIGDTKQQVFCWQWQHDRLL